METATKVEIHYDAYRYEMSIKHWNRRTELLKSIDHEIKKYFPGMKIKIDSLFPYPEVELYKLVEKKYAQNNPMGLSGIKLAELHEMDFRNLLNNQLFEYHKMIDMKKKIAILIPCFNEEKTIEKILYKKSEIAFKEFQKIIKRKKNYSYKLNYV